MKKLLILFCSLLLNGVFGTDEVKVSVNEGDSVTLEIKPEDRKGDSSLVWRFNGKTEILGKLFLANKKSEVIDPKDRIFGNRLKLNNQTGSLTITNITPEHSGLYVIKASIDTIKTFRVSVIDKMNTVSVTEGYPLTLTGVTDGRIDDVKWKFTGADLTCHIDSTFNNCEVNHQTGDLNITKIRRNQSGDYEVRINGGSFILLRTYRVNVSGLSSHWTITGPVLLGILLLVLLLVVLYVIYKLYKKRHEVN